jgi:hypothetical protein
MRNVLPFILGALLLGCKTEVDVDRANENTFIRYFGSENNNIAHLALEADGGFTVLSTIQTPTDNFGHFMYQIQMIHTDAFGNKISQQAFPPLTGYKSDNGESLIPEGLVGGLRAASFEVTESGYLIVGDSINESEESKLLLLEVDFQLNEIKKEVFGYPADYVPAEQAATISLQGKAVTKDKTGNYLVLANISNNSVNSDDMFVAKVLKDFTSSDPIDWWRTYGAGSGRLVNRIFYKDPGEDLTPGLVLWGGSVTINDKSDIRIIQSPEDAQHPNLANAIGTPSHDELAADLSEGITDYAFVGSSKSGQDNDIFFARVSKGPNPELVDSASFTFNDKNANLNEEGVSVCASGGSYLILANVESGVKGNGGKDYYLLKVDRDGLIEWEYNYGGSDNDEGASIRATSDGGYIMLGTTSYGNLKKLVLMKVNAQGRL